MLLAESRHLDSIKTDTVYQFRSELPQIKCADSIRVTASISVHMFETVKGLALKENQSASCATVAILLTRKVNLFSTFVGGVDLA